MQRGCTDVWTSKMMLQIACSLSLRVLSCMQAGANVPGNLKNVEKLMEHPAFSMTNPNACYSLFLSFLRSSVNFHAADGSGYKFIADSVLKVGGCLSRLRCVASLC